MISARKNGLDINVPDAMVPEDMKNQALHPWEKLNKFGRHKSNPNSFIPGHVDHINATDMTSKRFYQQYLARNKPVYIFGGAAHWDAMEKWKNGTYLRS